jgi:hypothetical protein
MKTNQKTGVKMETKNYNRAESQLTGRCKNRRKIGNNTYLERRNGYIAVKLHNTDIIEFHPDKTVLTSSGWRTVTTKARLNEFAPVSIYQHKGTWYIGEWQNNGNRILFIDGMELDPDNNPVDPQYENKDRQKNQRELIAEIKAYAKLCADNCPIPLPSGGDCWYCHLETVETKRPLGESIQDTEHLKSHFAESYIVPSLVYRACKEYGISIIAWEYLQGRKGQDLSTFADITKRQIQSAIYRFVKRQFGIAS